MKRKLVQQGPSTLMVSLPREWVKKNNLGKGDEVSLDEKENAVIVSGKERKVKVESRSINLDNLTRLTERIINSAYRKGIDEITLQFPNSATFSEIQRALQEVVGFEIVDQTEKSCVLKSVSTSTLEEFDVMLRRMFLMLLEMADSTFDALQKKEYKRLEEVKLLETTNNRFSAFCRRMLNKEIYDDQIKTTQLYIISRDLEKIADQYKHMCSYGSKKKPELTPEVKLLFKKANEYLREFYELFYSYDIQRAQKFVLHKDQLVTECLSLLDKQSTIKKQNSKLVHNLTNVVQLTFDMVSQIFVINL